MGNLEQSHRDDWRLASHLAGPDYNEHGGPDHHDADAIRAHLIDSRKYNGWANYETWSVNLILSNDKELDDQTRATAYGAAEAESDASLKRVRVADALKDFVTDELLYDTFEHCTNDGNAGMLASQLLSASLSEVDWLEIADAFSEA